MPSASQRARTVQASPIRKLKPLADQAKRAGKRVYHLNIGQPDIPTPTEYFEGIRHAAQGVLAYSPSQGLDETLDALSEYYRTFEISLGREELLVTAGGSEAITFALLAITDVGDQILVPEPFYTNYNSYAQITGIHIVPVETRAQDGFRLPDKKSIEAKITPKTKAILFCNPGNPTGVVYTRAELELLAEIARRHNFYLISDEVYREFTYDDAQAISVLQLPDLDDRAILVDSISKRFSACGARLGVIASKNASVMESALKFAQARLSPPTLEQYGLIYLLKSSHYQNFVREMIAEFARRRDLVYAELQQMPGVLCPKPQGAFYTIAKLPVAEAERFTRWLLTDFSLDNETVMLAPAAEFYATPGKGRDEVRIAYVLNVDALKRAMKILREGLQVYTTEKRA
ncbi:pyridoxal phosphate-dependent aminotransferase [Candidatus Acetothermia bacterium]|jgi:aspartate aminotransferase|nr:pyridoxal phosphate-dependent aminotransferase [Candidatus Acetothermia bacterium]MCI2432269.1 pyridoxal phosphate-dependent aminotransferase [Candidatus Acetothermia bacterium]MCI2436525.1 pyridoxal phosphate-dependent aminotransferase [Candidatus Acetothermia bacterium]